VFWDQRFIWQDGGSRGERGCLAFLGHLVIFSLQGQYCDICTAANSNKAHPVSNAIDGTERWWQSPPLSRGLEYNEVNVTLDLGQVGFIFGEVTILGDKAHGRQGCWEQGQHRQRPVGGCYNV
jgi:hypothetical protein